MLLLEAGNQRGDDLLFLLTAAAGPIHQHQFDLVAALGGHAEGARADPDE